MSLIKKLVFVSFIIIGLLSLVKYISSESTFSLEDSSNTKGTVIAREPGV